MCIYQLSSLAGPHRRYGNDHGIALIAALMFLMVLSLLGAAVATVTTLYSQVSGNYRASIQAFQAAEAGVEEARARLRANAANPIVDASLTQPLQAQQQWTAYLGSVTQAKVYGYTASSGQQVPIASLQNPQNPVVLQYTVVITHATDAKPDHGTGTILLWGDPTNSGVNTRNITGGQNIYVVTSYGTAGGALSKVQTQVARRPRLSLPAALYVSGPTKLGGSSTTIYGNDQCGSTSLAGVGTSLPSTQPDGGATIAPSGSSTPDLTGTPTPIQYNTRTLDVPGMVNSLKGAADFPYNLTSNTTQTERTTPGPGDAWGTPTDGAHTDPSSCTESHTVYYNMHGTTLKLDGSVTGCGILLVDGNLEIHGGFDWYGVVIVTGSITYSGGGNKNISGALVSGGANLQDTVAGNATILNCSAAILNSTVNQPLGVLSWGQL